MITLVSLPVDILDRIMTSVSNFRTLSASIGTCAKLRSVYDARPNSIRTAVGHNLFGSRRLCSAALKTLRIERALDANSDEFSEEADWIKAQLLSVSQSDVQDISWPEARALEERAQICMGLETFYSQGYKDKLTLGTSRLTTEESDVFRMALLRVWYMLSILAGGGSVREVLEPFEVRLSTFYNLLSDQELYEFQLIWEWLSSELDGMGEVDALQILTVGGLDGFLQRCEVGGDVDPEYDSDWDVDWCVEDDLSDIWRERRVDIPKSDDSEPFSPNGLKPILASASGQDDACAKCQNVLGLDLYNCQNWCTNRWLHHRDTGDLWYSLPLGLCNNAYEQRMYGRYVENPLRDFAENTASGAGADSPILEFDLDDDSPFWNADAASPVCPKLNKFHILRGLFDLETAVTNERLRAHLAKGGWSGITPEDWLCQSCLTDLVKERLWVWWYAEKASGRVRGCVLKSDCWYGYQCRTQMRQDGIHAEKLNHLTVNTSAEREAAKASRGPGGKVQPGAAKASALRSPCRSPVAGGTNP